MVWRYLPRARSRMLAACAALVAAFYAAIAVFFALNVMREPVGLVVAPLFGLLAWGMWKLARAARWVTIIWMWVLVVAMPMSVFTPRGAEGAYWGALLAAATPFVAAGLFFIYVFGKHKREFKWP